MPINKQLSLAVFYSILVPIWRMDVDFSAGPQKSGLAFVLWSRTTFALEIRQKHTGPWIKVKGSNWDIMDKEH